MPCGNCSSIARIPFSFMIFSENATIHMKNDHILVFSRNNFLLETSQPNTETFHKAMRIEFKIVMHEKQRLPLLTTCKAIVKDTQNSTYFDFTSSYKLAY